MNPGWPGNKGSTKYSTARGMQQPLAAQPKAKTIITVTWNEVQRLTKSHQCKYLLTERDSQKQGSVFPQLKVGAQSRSYLRVGSSR